MTKLAGKSFNCRGHMTVVEKKQPRAIAVFGAGIAGLSAAHEFARSGCRVAVYEQNRDAGGFFRSARLPGDHDMPTEYSWHGMGPWYHNVFDLMKQIPFDEQGSMYERALSRPIDFGLAPDEGEAAFDDTLVVNVKNMFRMSWLDVVRGTWLMLKTWMAGRRTVEHYSTLNASEQWKPRLSERAWKTWRSSFGPWIGSDWKNVSLHTAGQFFHKQLMTRPAHSHQADEEGPAWQHGARTGWLLLRGPSNECWFDRWVEHLEKQGVVFYWEQPLHHFDFDGEKITGAHTEGGVKIDADLYVLATNPFAAAEILDRTPELAQEEQLRLFKPLIQDGPHTQVSFRIAFAERIQWSRERTALVIADSEYNLTMFAQEQAWLPEVNLGQGVKSLWTGTACVSSMPGRVYGLPLARCTKEQFIDEVKAQLFACGALDSLIREANDGRGLKDFPILKIEVWHEWQFSPEGIKHRQPKWVTTTHTQPHLPTQATSIRNLVLAGAHTKTEADVWSIEGAVESGRRAAKVIDSSVKVISQYKARWLRALSTVDDVCFAMRGPHLLDTLLFALLLALGIWALWQLALRM
ncbi:MAG: FAD-dependent oxidoreductase [Pirellulaceae bacterium]